MGGTAGSAPGAPPPWGTRVPTPRGCAWEGSRETSQPSRWPWTAAGGITPIRETLRNAGEIEIVFDRRLTDRLKVILMIDNGGWSMEPYVELVQTLFSYARSQFKDLRTYYFHNSVYDVVWQDAQRYYRPERLDELSLRDPETRLIFLGDASMSPYELMYAGGAIDYTQRSTRPSIERLKFLAGLFRHAVWLNPSPLWEWDRVRTIGIVRQVFPMYELTLDGLEGAVRRLVAKN
jgi:uncharacterized protein with von Willebrand factor type A (vWA) domain